MMRANSWRCRIQIEMPAFDPKPVVFTSIELGDSGMETRKIVNAIAEKFSLPHLKEFLHDLADRLLDSGEAFGRGYQREVLRHNCLEVISPVSGRIVTARRSYVVGGMIFYEFADCMGYFVASSRVSVGYPLTALFIPGLNVILKWEALEKRKVAKHKGIQLPHLSALAVFASVGNRPEAKARAARTVVVVGHKNFAHHLWNELPAFEKLLAEDSCVPIPELLVKNEPLGPIDAIFPELAGWPIVRLKGRQLVSANGPGKLFVNLGSYRISTAVRKRLVSFAANNVTAKTSALINDIRKLNGPVFWLSVRTNTPTFLNQRDVLLAISVALLKQFRNCAIVFDGFSLPYDWEDADEDREELRALSRAGKDEIDAIVGELTRQSYPLPSQQIVNAGGLGILDTITLAQPVDAYFCHAGTFQHKIGWTANKPGLIHGFLAADGRFAAQHAERLEGGVVPGVLDRAMLEPVEENYRAVDCGAVARFVTGYFNECLTSGSMDRSFSRERSD